ncbi:MAG: Flp pilus assembly complex ATPase component TadA [Candidatus Omnitrophica bacterium]|nr:Flp pilus assembly complex ATPase component TadA [Candidatus Omnitrophota bacterium]
MDRKIDARVIRLLKETKNLDEENLKSCFIKAENKQNSPIPIIAANTQISEVELLEIIAQDFRTEYVDLRNTSIEKSLIKKVPVKIAAYYKFAPMHLENRLLTIARAYPLDIKILDEIRTHLGYSINVVLSTEQDVNEMLKKYYGLGASTVEKIIAQKAYEHVTSKKQDDLVDDLEETGESTSVIQLVNQIILEAFTKRATDIHIEPYRSKLRLRYRIDGILYDANVSPEINNFLIPILSRIKLMSNLNIVEKRVPQDGRAIVQVQGQTLDLRVSFIPTPHGESVVIRILPTVMLFGLDKLGLTSIELDFFKQLISKPHGIIFVTGPTGSGKTTTLYTCLSSINTSERKIITIEDPIEYELEGITQIQITPEVGLDFSRGLRSMLRHDPDVMMVGEVRDLETAEIAIRVALTGHLVFSTLHTNDAASGITRLIDIGLEPYLVASSVDAFIAQRLLRLNCPHCKAEDIQVVPGLKAQILKELGKNDDEEIKIYRSKGCQACNFTGFYGRTAIHEILVLNEKLKALTAKKASSDEIKKCAVADGMKTLRQSGWIKVLEGQTTADEVLRVTQADVLPENMISVEQATYDFKKDEKPSKMLKLEMPEKIEQTIKSHDQRIHERIENKLYLHYKMFKTKTKDSGELEYEPELIGVTKNISAGGVLLNSVEYISKGTILDVNMEMPNNERKIECLARVIRCTEVVPDKNYEIAICFLDLASAERSRLNRYINSVSS